MSDDADKAAPATDDAPAAATFGGETPAPVATLDRDAPDLDGVAILGMDDRKIERLYVPEWGGNVYLRTISGTERDDFEAALVLGGKMTTQNIRAKLLVQVLCDKAGNKLFTPEQVDALGAKAAAGLTRCYNRASKLNAISDADVDDLAKNSGRGAIEAS